jgi:hypothetical protein
MQAPAGITRCSRPLRARRTITCPYRNPLRGYPRLSAMHRPISRGCPQGSHVRREQRNTHATRPPASRMRPTHENRVNHARPSTTLPIRERGATRDCSGSSAIGRNLMSQPHIGRAARQARREGASSGRFRSRCGEVALAPRPTLCHCLRGEIGGQQNAQRNLATVASDSNASTGAVTFDLVAPSGKTYITTRSAACQPRLSTSFKVRGPIPSTLSTDFPRSSSAEPSVTPREPTPALRRGSGRRGRRVPMRGCCRRRRRQAVGG